MEQATDPSAEPQTETSVSEESQTETQEAPSLESSSRSDLAKASIESEPSRATDNSEQPSQPAPILSSAGIRLENYTEGSTTFDVLVTSTSTTKKIKYAKIAIWSVENGQDDLRWIDIPISDNQGTKTLDISQFASHSGNIDYRVHVYVDYEDGSRDGTNLGDLSFQIPTVVSTITTTTNSSYTIQLTNVPAHFTHVKIPVWSQKNGQDDLKWYPATSLGNGVWQVIVDTADHKGDTGHYEAHAYGYNQETKKQEFLLATSGFDRVSGKANAAVQVKNYSETSQTFDVTIAPQADTQKIESVQIAVWSEEDGQDDLKWYTPAIVQNGASQTIDIANHANKTGNYTVHVYVKYADTGTVGYNAGTYHIERPTPKQDLTTSLQADGIHVAFKTDALTDYSQVRFAVWSETDGQDDLRWYTSSKTGEIVVPYSSHKGYGTYHIHVYQDVNGKMNGLTTGKIELTKPSLQADISKVNETQYSIRLTGVAYDLEEVQVPVWSDNGGQDDIKWYKAIKQGDGTYQVVVSLADHKFDTGHYKAHVYGKTKLGGETIGIGTTSGFTVEAPAAPTGKVSITNYNTQHMRFDVVVSDILAPGGLKEVKVPVWSDNGGQDDIKWYTAVKQSDGSYKATVYLSDHRYDFGTYHAHAYLLMENNRMEGIATTKAHLEKPENAIFVKTSYQGTGLYHLEIAPVATSGNVIYAVWSEAGGQDDVRWYTASRKQSTTFEGNFNAQYHSGTGTYHIHIYEEVAGQLRGLTTTTVQVNRSDYSAPYYSQVDSRWSNQYFGAWRFGPTGCVPTVMAMIISGATGSQVTPVDVGNYLHNQTLEFNRSFMGTSSRGVVLAAKNWGLKTATLNSYADLATALQEGHFVAAGVGSSKFIAAGGHELVLKGYNNGQTYVMDPNRPSNNGWYSIDYIWNVASTDPIDRTEGYPFIKVTD